MVLEKLKKIFETNFSDIFKNANIKIFDFSNNDNRVLEVKGDKLGLDISKASEDERKLIKEEILDFIIQKQDELFLTSKINDKTRKIERNLPEEKDKELLRFYKDKLNPDIYNALEMALVIRKVYLRSEEIKDLKKDVSLKYPQLGNNVCNLVTEGYFDVYFRELYHNMAEENDFSVSLYQDEVERIVKSLPYMVFISRYKSYDEFGGEVKFKLEKLRKYGLEKLKLHGLSRENVETALKISDGYKDDPGISIDPQVNPSKTRVTITFTFVRTSPSG